MRDLRRRPAALILVCAVSLVGSACGSSSHSDTVGQPPRPRHTGARTSAGATFSTHRASGTRATRSAASTPTVGAGSETAAFTKTVLPASTPIRSAAYHDAVVRAVGRARKNPKTGEAIAGCIQQILQNAGIETVGEADKIKQDPTGNKQVATGALQCLGSAAP